MKREGYDWHQINQNTNATQILVKYEEKLKKERQGTARQRDNFLDAAGCSLARLAGHTYCGPHLNEILWHGGVGGDHGPLVALRGAGGAAGAARGHAAAPARRSQRGDARGGGSFRVRCNTQMSGFKVELLCVQRGRIYIRRINKNVVSPILHHGGYAYGGGHNVFPVLLHAPIEIRQT